MFRRPFLLALGLWGSADGTASWEIKEKLLNIGRATLGDNDSEKTKKNSTLGEYSLAISYVSKDFFSKFRFWTEKDPTNGFVEYVSADEAMAERLAWAVDGGVYMGADTRGRSGPHGRRSVRVQSLQTFNSGLFILKVDHIPTGCGTWPAFWLYGEDALHVWPEWGEFDIVEGVHNMDSTLTTLHTTALCKQTKVLNSSFTGHWANGSMPGSLATDCDVNAPKQWHNQGCSQFGPKDSMGAGFNTAGGGTFAAEWDPVSGYMRTWYWPLSLDPEELQSHLPDPDSWGTPFSSFIINPDDCDAGHFKNMRIVFDLTFCGDWAGNTFSQMCPGTNQTCEEFVAQFPENMTEAYWSIRELDVYLRGAPPVVPSKTTTQMLRTPTKTTTPRARTSTSTQPLASTTVSLKSSLTTVTSTSPYPNATSSLTHIPTSTSTKVEKRTSTVSKASKTTTTHTSTSLVPAVLMYPPPRSHWGSELLAALLSLLTVMAAAACLRNQRLTFGGGARSPPMPSALLEADYS